MCLETVARVHSLVPGDETLAVVETASGPRRVSLALLVLEGGVVEPGDRVLVHTGFVVRRLEEAEAEDLVTQREEMRDALKENTT